MPTTNWSYLSFEIITHNCHQILVMIIFEKLLEINPTRLSDTLANYKNKDCFRIFSYSQNKWQGINPMGIGAPWTDSYLHNWRDEMFLVMFINKLLWSVLHLFLIPLIKILKTTTNRKNLGLLTWIQSIYWWQQVKYPSTHKTLAID